MPIIPVVMNGFNESPLADRVEVKPRWQIVMASRPAIAYSRVGGSGREDDLP